ncbi:fibronectin type III domain-containing protein [Actinoplanes derwentensis]|nr:fibronectin type III domain-containing protein [Actinoplanes derwentensis]
MTTVAIPTAAYAVPAVPKNLTVARTTEDVHKIRVGWKAVEGAQSYTLDVIAGDVESVLELPATTTEYTIDNPDPCTAYKVRVGAVDATGAGASTGYFSLRALTPSAVMGMTPGRTDEGTTATAVWRAPAWTGYTPLTGYRAVFVRLSDGAVLADQTSTDTSFKYSGIDASRAYTLAVTTVNEFGACTTAKSLLDRYRPADPTDLVVKRQANAPETVQMSWKAPATGPPPTYYQVGYGTEKVTKTVRVEATATSTTVALATDKKWVVEVKAYNDNGGSSAVTGSVPVWEAPAVTPTPEVTPTPTASPVPGEDRTPPTITTTLSQKAVNGWFRTPVTISFVCADDSGVVAFCPAPVLADTDGAAQRYSGTARDGSGNTATTTLTLKIDQKAPTITGTVLGDRNAAGWFAAAPTVRYTCADETSLIFTCPPETVINSEGSGQQISGIALDKAGNTATSTAILNVDRTAPVITATVTGTKDASGWYRTTPTVHFTCTDKTSGIAVCPAPTTLTNDGTAQTVTGTTTDNAGNTATTKVTLDVDHTAPVVTATVTGDKGESGWYRTAPVVTFTCTDEASGMAVCPAPVTLTTDGAAQTVTGEAVDSAGNTATAKVVLDVDHTGPAIIATVAGTKDASGWYRTAPVVTFTCTDEASGVAVCPAPSTLTAEGAAQVVTGTGTDNAGNTATTKVTLDIDHTAPVVTAAVNTTPDSNGWYRTAPTVTFTCTDEGSGVAVCPAPTTLTAEGAAQVVTGTGTDNAGNTATTKVTLNVDHTAPVVTIAGAVPGTVYGPDAPPTVSCLTADAGSGVAVRSAITRTEKRGLITVICAGAVDKAGNAATAVQMSYSVRPTVEWLMTLTRKYAPGASATVLRQLESDLNNGNTLAYVIRVSLLTLGNKPALTSAQASTLAKWATELASYR